MLRERWPYLTEQLHTRHALYTNHLCWSVLPSFIFSLTIAFPLTNSIKRRQKKKLIVLKTVLTNTKTLTIFSNRREKKENLRLLIAI